MSRIIRYAVEAPAVFIGEKQVDALSENRAEKTLASIFPVVSLITAPDGARLIPIIEVHKIHKTLQERCVQARAEGYQEGYQEGEQKGLDEARKVLTQLDQAINDAINQRATMLNEAKQKILELVVQISKKVTFEAIEIDRESTVKLIEGVINELIDRSRMKIKVHPDDLPMMEQNIDRFLVGSTAIKELTFEADPRVRMGGCFIETPTGDIDARLESQFEVIADTLQVSKG